ncbi:MAG: hypothetical protein AAB492_02975 [Patescibacteria group bacterium]
MAGEELSRRLTEAAKKVAEQATQQKAEQSQSAENASVENVAPSNVHEVPAERMVEFTNKLSHGVSEAAQKIIGAGEYPQDERVFSIVESLLGADEAMLSDSAYMRTIGEKLATVVNETGYFSDTGVEARKYLHRIIAENPSLEDLRLRAMPEVSGGSGVADPNVEDDADGIEEYGISDPEYREQVRQLYDEPNESMLKDTPVGKELKDLQYRLEVDPESLFRDQRMVDQVVTRIVTAGQRENLDPKLVREAVSRARALEGWVAEKNEALETRGLIRWSDVKGDAPKGVEHADNQIFGFRDISKDEIDKYFKRGAEGEADWYFNFIDQIYSLGREESRPGLTHEQRFQEFKDYLVWKYGDEYHLAVQLYQKHWDSRGQFEYAVKGLMYNPGDVKDRLKAMSLLTGADLDHLYKNFNNSNVAYNLYEHVMFETMAEKRRKYGEAVKYMKESTSWKGERFESRDKLLDRLKSKQREEGVNDKGERTQSSLTIEDQKLMYEIQIKRDLAAEGVMLWDDDVQSYTELHITLSKLQHEREGLMKKKDGGEPLTEKEMDQLHEVDRLYQIYAKRDHVLNENFTQELLQTRGLSPVDIEVRKRMTEYYKSTHDGKEPPEYEVRMALWAARTAMIGSGRMAMIGAMMSILPGVEYQASGGKHVMRAPAFEDLQRIFNPEAFASRFSIGGDFGLVARNVFRKNLLNTKGIDQKKTSWIGKKINSLFGNGEESSHGKLSHSKEWAHAKHEEHDPIKLAAMETAEFAEDVSGISFSELLGPGFMNTGGHYDGGAWRLEKGVFDELKNKVMDMKKLPEGATLLDNQALSIQILTAADASERKPILDRMLRRNPSKFLELLQEDSEKILQKHNVTHEEWGQFKEALSLAELKLAHEKEWQFARVDMADKKDFDALVSPFLKTLGMEDAGRQKNLRQVITDMQSVMYEKRKVETGGGKVYFTKMDAVADLKLPLTMSLTDFDWKESNFYQLGTVAMHRKIRDIGAQMRARDAILGIISNQEMVLSPNDYTKTLEKFREVREAIIDYSGADAAEATVKELARVFLEMNRHRHLNLQWIPADAGSWLLRQIGEWDLRRFKNNTFMEKVAGKERWHKLSESSFLHWPHSAAEYISYSVRYTGGHGNAFDENKMEEVIATMEEMGLFINHHEYGHDLRNEFNTRLGTRLWSQVRKYWFMLFAVTVGIAALQGIEDEKKNIGGGGH